MKIDAHYYALLAFCRAVGFKKKAAHTVAYASQFVDDADINHIILTEFPNDTKVETINQKPSLFNMATAHDYFKVSTLNYSAMINNTTAFHFVPGCEGDNFSKKMRCKEESQVIMEILNDVKKDSDLVKLGIVLHAYADTFSHQGFSGIVSKVNNIKDCRVKDKIYDGMWDKLYYYLYPVIDKSNKLKNFLIEKIYKWIKVSYGHAQALSFTDLPYLKWEYKYDYSSEFSNNYELAEINNQKRFKKAFEKIKFHLEDYLEKWPEYREDKVSFDDFDVLFKSLVRRDSIKARNKNWKKVLIELDLFDNTEKDIINYDENLWLKKAFDNFDRKKFSNRKVKEVKLSSNFSESNWYKYYLGVKWYKDKFYGYIEDYHLDLPQ